MLALLDTRGRPLRDLRISVMDRCNFRCTYCMPEGTYGPDYRFMASEDWLSFDEIERICRTCTQLGVSKLRLTGGEPLLRPGLPDLVARLRAIPGITDLALTTNGMLLTRQAEDLRKAGLDRITVSLDALEPALFHQMSGGRGSVAEVLAGVQAAVHAGFPQGIKINTVVQRGVNESSVPDLVAWSRATGVIVRFIEYMDVGNRNQWQRQDIVSSDQLLSKIQERWPVEAVPAHYPGEVATRYRFLDGQGEIGLISSISKPFCGDCSRARLSADGTLYTCLFSTQGTDLRALLRSGLDDQRIEARVHEIWAARSDRYSELRGRGSSTRSSGRKIEMHYIGG
ncbi:cyclic pyranopterin phosphate synthase [Pseudoxanthomonas sp. 3HH-4]|nr:cyclic pyranopterin phosphate synthase [Pseudoxanthomonas sp. 3HH-4]